jgi:competence protein ComEC
LKKGDCFTKDSVRIDVLAPDDSARTLKVANDDSMVLMVNFHSKRLLLTGDAELNTENKLLKISNLQSDYLKAAHHGSASSSSLAFLHKLKMKTVFISVGKNNWFGHPSRAVLERYRQRHALVYRTDQLGTIRLTLTPNQEDSIDTFLWSR